MWPEERHTLRRNGPTLTLQSKMNKPELKQAFTETMQSYLDALDRYSDEQFAAKPDEAEWSLGQMYQHLYEANTYFFLANVKRCLEKRKGQEGGEMTAAGQNVHQHNSFPPIKVKRPAAPNSPEPVAQDREAYRVLYAQTLREGLDWAEALAQDDGSYKTQHYVFGWLNATEWLQGLEIHARHHIRQRHEREAWLGIATV